eukprot:1535528-Amphidinium_carterae.1
MMKHGSQPCVVLSQRPRALPLGTHRLWSSMFCLRVRRVELLLGFSKAHEEVEEETARYAATHARPQCKARLSRKPGGRRARR